jgi:hypothetical protein
MPDDQHGDGWPVGVALVDEEFDLDLRLRKPTGVSRQPAGGMVDSAPAGGARGDGVGVNGIRDGAARDTAARDTAARDTAARERAARGRAAPAGAAPAGLDLLDDEFDLDVRLGELTYGTRFIPFDAQTDPVGLPTAGLGAGETCNTQNNTCPITCAGHNTCPETQCATCPETCPETCPDTCVVSCFGTCDNTCPETCPDTCIDTCPGSCGGTCENTCPDTCGETCPNTCGETCPNTCETCDFARCHLTEGIENTCDLFFSCECA